MTAARATPMISPSRPATTRSAASPDGSGSVGTVARARSAGSGVLSRVVLSRSRSARRPFWRLSAASSWRRRVSMVAAASLAVSVISRMASPTMTSRSSTSVRRSVSGSRTSARRATRNRRARPLATTVATSGSVSVTEMMTTPETPTDSTSTWSSMLAGSRPAAWRPITASISPGFVTIASAVSTIAAASSSLAGSGPKLTRADATKVSSPVQELSSAIARQATTTATISRL